MRIRIFALAMGVVSALALSSVAPAQDDGDDYARDEEETDEDEGIQYDYARSDFYVIAQGANQIGTFRGNPTSSLSTQTEHSMGAKGAFGYRINPHLAAEIQIDWVQKFDVKLNGSNKGFNGGGVTAQVKGYPLTGKIQPFGVFGLGVGAFEIRHTKETKYRNTQAEFMLRFGLGVDFWFTDQVGMVLDGGYAWPTGASGKLDDLDYATIGWGFILRFGGD
jgi:hypothetical protein